MSGLPGLSVQRLIAAADDAEVKRLLPDAALALAGSIAPSALQGAALREVVLAIRSPEELVRDDPTLQRLLSLLPDEKASELVATLRLPLRGDSRESLSGLRRAALYPAQVQAL